MIVWKLLETMSKSSRRYDRIKRLFGLIRKTYSLFREPFNPSCDNTNITLFNVICRTHI